LLVTAWSGRHRGFSVCVGSVVRWGVWASSGERPAAERDRPPTRAPPDLAARPPGASEEAAPAGRSAGNRRPAGPRVNEGRPGADRWSPVWVRSMQ